MKKTFIGIVILSVMILAFSSCQKVRTTPAENNTKTQLTPKQITLKKGMQQAAIVIAQISGNTEVQKEIQNLINLRMYNDDYIKFKDLFHPKSNSKLKTASTTLFAQAFRKVINNGDYKHLKSTNISDLEQFLIDNNLTLYVPYPLSDYPENMRTPTVTFDPLDNDSVNMGYVVSNFKSTNSVETVPKVDESYSVDHPVYIVTPQPLDTTGISASSSSGNNGNTKIMEVKIGEIYCTDYHGGLFAGGLNLRFLRSETNPIDINTGKVTGHFVTAISFKLRRKYVRYAKHGWQKGWYNVNVPWSTNWKPSDTQVVMAIYVKKHHVEYTITGTAKVKIDSVGEVGYTVTAKYSTRYSDVIGINEWDRNWFIATNKIGDGNVYGGSEFRDGWPIRAMSPTFWFTTPSRNFN